MQSGSIEIPVTVVLTQDAVDQITSRGKRPGSVQTVDGGESFGFTTHSIGTEAMQGMLTRGFLSKIELVSADPLTLQSSIIDLTKLIIYTLLYIRFESDANKLVFQSEVIRHWNRTNPSRIIDEKTHFKSAVIAQLLESRKEERDAVQQAVLAGARTSAVKPEGGSNDDRERCEQLCRRYFNCVRPSVWYVVLLLFSGEEREAITQALGGLIGRYASTSEVADYFAGTLNELIVYAQHNNMLARAKMQLGTSVTDAELLGNEPLRRKLIEAMAEHHEELHVVWRIADRAGITERRRTLSVSVFNKEYEFQIIRNELHRQMTMKARDLRAYLEQSVQAGGASDAGLGYLSYLYDAAQTLGVQFDSLVRQDERLDFTMITLTLQF